MRTHLLGIVGLVIITAAVFFLFDQGGADHVSVTTKEEEHHAQEPQVAAMPSAPVREEVPQPAAKDSPKPWDPSVLKIDPHWCVPMDLKQNLHWHINMAPLYQGEFIPPNYQCRVFDIVGDDWVNPNKVKLTDEEVKQLTDVLKGDNEVLLNLCKDEWKLKGVALHEAIERGDYLVSGPMNTTSMTPISQEELRERVQPVADQEASLRQRFGEPFQDYFHVVSGGPPTDTKTNFIIFVPRASAPGAFKKAGQVVTVMEHARMQAQEFIGNLRR
jgi:hypothetical protein